MPEAWLNGPVEGISPLLQPAAHGLLNARQQIEKALQGLSSAQLTARPGGAASIAYHVTHAIGSLDRLFTYARGEGLSPAQQSALAAESVPLSDVVSPDSLVAGFDAAIAKAFEQLSNTGDASLTEHRAVGRAGLPSTVIGLLFHGAEHTARHAGQVVTTALVVRQALPSG